MANTYTQLYFHVVFAVRGRAKSINPNWKIELYKYVSGIITHKGQKLIRINGMPDHIHILMGLKPDCSLSIMVRDIKSNSSRWINEKKNVCSKFYWQLGFGAFTVSHSQLNTVDDYIKNQEKHHKSQSFSEEYMAFLKSNNIQYQKKYLF